MFRNLRYSNTDYSVTVNDGYVIFRWWLPHQTDKQTDQAYKVFIIFEKKNKRFLKLMETYGANFACSIKTHFRT